MKRFIVTPKINIYLFKSVALSQFVFFNTHIFMQTTTSANFMEGDVKEPSSPIVFWNNFYLNKNVSIVLKTIEQQDEGKQVGQISSAYVRCLMANKKKLSSKYPRATDDLCGTDVRKYFFIISLDQ